MERLNINVRSVRVPGLRSPNKTMDTGVYDTPKPAPKRADLKGWRMTETKELIRPGATPIWGFFFT